ncbi:hypothetical protein [uncultured Megamonas sp.]|uniref:hypothetical protein n=1 Tax=uncultured Megamonas sp. TaxID=286140 RepID=UPI00259B9DC5|nr:hypothetical protein [uncultured Megamonas sp.]
MELPIKEQSTLENIRDILIDYVKVKEENKLLKQQLSGKNNYSKYCSPAGISTAKQVEEFTGLKPSMVRELGYRGVFEEIREGKMVRYKFSSVLAFVQGKPKLKVI